MTVSSIMTITPEMATRWLEANESNRSVRQSAVDQYAAAMKAGKWKLNGSTIGFAESGRLLDGQHRLFACIEAGTPFESVVVTGLAEEVFTTIDQGRFRNPGDHLKIGGFDVKGEQNRFAAAIGVIIRYDRGSVHANEKLAPDELLSFVQANPGIADWFHHVRNHLPKGLRTMTTQVAAVLWVGQRTGKLNALAELFLQQFATGVGLQPGSPVLTLRNRIISNTPSERGERFYVVLTSWNHFARGKPLHKIAPTKDGHMPKIVGDK